MSTSHDIRLTRRGRLVVTLVSLWLILAAFIAFSAGSAALDATGTSPAVRTLVVEEGDTLWGIASTLDRPGRTTDIRELVHEIETLNALTGPELVEGQHLAVPAS